ncbi:DUF1492 domain-containing protein [Proteinivorax tanatarense]|uniref:DUF1492 domain-containing protein n=1 Tax=Proteinivorax tanatarense TaxID=1260629 RepID=A0AAU7VIG2_9FIRM
MNAKEYLSQAIWLDKIIQNKLEQKEKLKSIAQKATTDFSQEKVSGSKIDKSAMESATVKIVDLQHEINSDIDRLIDLKTEILQTIALVGDTSHQLILEMRYINGKGWEEVAYNMGFDVRTIFRIHGKAIKEIEKIKSCQ